MVENEVIAANLCLLITQSKWLLAYFIHMGKASKKKNRLSVVVKNLLSKLGEYSGSFLFFYSPSVKFTPQCETGEC